MKLKEAAKAIAIRNGFELKPMVCAMAIAIGVNKAAVALFDITFVDMKVMKNNPDSTA